MNSNLYVENANGALKWARKEIYDKVLIYMCFYRDTKGFAKYYQKNHEEIINMAGGNWQAIMNTVNANALYLGLPLYREHLNYLEKLKELMMKPEQGRYSIVKEWLEKYPDLEAIYDTIEKSERDTAEGKLFMDFVNQLHIAANKEFLSKLV